MRAITAASVATLLLAGAIAPVTASAHRDGLRHNYKHLYYAVKHQFGPRAPGRQIVSHGIKTKTGVRAATKHEIAKSIRQLRRLLTPPPQPTLIRTAVPPTQAPAQVRTASVAAGGTLSSIAACESGGNPSAIDASGTYRGKYQFDYGTWASVGGSGDPAAASEAEQDRRAAMLYAQRGGSPWPICSRR